MWANSIQGEIVFQMYKGEKKDRVKITLGTVFYWFKVKIQYLKHD